MSELNSNKQPGRIEEERIAHIMLHLLAGLPPGTATMDSKEDPSGRIWYLTPSNKRSAAFRVHFDGTVDVFFGRGTTFELPYESGLPRDADFEAVLGWLKAMGLAVIAGRCKDRLGFLGTRGTIWVNGKPYRVSSFFHFRLHPKTLHYAPYAKTNG